MGGRAWSQEELIRLEELTETYPLATVARKLNRSENAVFLKRQRTGIGGFMANTEMQAACTECGLKIESRRTNP